MKWVAIDICRFLTEMCVLSIRQLFEHLELDF